MTTIGEMAGVPPRRVNGFTALGASANGWVAALPEEVLRAFESYRTCEFSTFAKDGTPVTWPTTPLFQPDEGRFVVGTSIALNRKALHVRREPRVAMLFSDPIGSDQVQPPTVLVQGIAECPEELFVGGPLVHAYYRNIARLQRMPWLFRSMFRRVGWIDYYIRLFIYIRPTRISWWPTGDTRAPAHTLEVSDVA